MRQTIFLSFILAVFLVPCLAQDKIFDESVLSQSGRYAYQTLLKTQLFAVGGINYGSEIAEGEKALDILFEETEATSAFKSLVKNATIEGSLYGLLGLAMTNCDCFQEEFINFKKSRTSNENNEKLSIQIDCSPYEIEKGKDKVSVLDYFITAFPEFASGKRKVLEQRKLLKERKKTNS